MSVFIKIFSIAYRKFDDPSAMAFNDNYNLRQKLNRIFGVIYVSIWHRKVSNFYDVGDWLYFNTEQLWFEELCIECNSKIKKEIEILNYNL